MVRQHHNKLFLLCFYELIHDMISREQINYIRYLARKNKLQYKPFDAVEVKRGIYVIDIPAKETIIGHVNGKRNVLNMDFFGAVFAIESANGIYSICEKGGYNPNAGSAYLEYGTGTVSPSFSQCGLQNPVGSIPTQLTIGTLSDRSRITLAGTLPADATEIGIYLPVVIVGPSTTWFGLGRIVGSFAKNSAVAYYIDFLQPWTENFALIVYSFLTSYGGVNLVTTSGSSCGVNWNSRRSASVLIGSVNSYSWSPSLYSISQDVIFSTSHSFNQNTSSVTDYIVGTATPSSTIQIQTLGLIQDYGCSDGNVLILALPLSSPITLYANQQNQINLRLVAY